MHNSHTKTHRERERQNGAERERVDKSTKTRIATEVSGGGEKLIKVDGL